MDTKARIGLFVGGLVLVGMVAYVMMPRSTDAKTEGTDLAGSSGVDYAAGPSTQPTAATTQPVAIDPFAAPATTALDIAPAPADAGATATATPAPADNNDVWARALETNTTQTRTGGSMMSQSSMFQAGQVPQTTTLAGAETPKSAVKTYKVEAGDSPFTIAQKLYGDGKYASRIMAANPKVNAKRLKIGQELTIPDLNSSEAAATPVARPETVTTARPTATVATASAKTYKVQAGDTLTRISTKVYGKSGMWKQLYAANKTKIGSDPTNLRAGMVLQVPENVQ